MDSDQLNREIDDLKSDLHGWFTTKDGFFWRGAWAKVREIGAAFGKTRFPQASDRDDAWNRFQTIVEEMKKEGEAHADRRRQQAEGSAEVKSEILQMAAQAWPRSEDAFLEFLGTITGAKIIAEIFVGALEMTVELFMRMVGLGDDRTAQQKLRDEMKQRSERLREAWSYFTSQKHRLLPADKDQCFKTLSGVQYELDLIWGELKRASAEQREQRERRFRERRSAKETLIREARALDPANKDDRQRAKEMMADWKAAGFAGTDHEDDLWQRFRAAVDRFWERNRAAIGVREDEFNEKRRRKRDLINEMESLDPSDRDDRARAKDIPADWKQVGFAGREHEDALWQELKAAMESFWQQHRDAMEAKEQEFEERRQEKRTLIDELEALDASDRDDRARAKEMMDDWKRIGFAGRDHEEDLWQEFRSAMDTFWQR